MEWYLQGLRNYTNFQGRATRKEFWMFVLFAIIFYAIIILSGFSCLYIGKIFTNEIAGAVLAFVSLGLILFSYLFLLSHLLPFISVGIRRLHDLGKNGWLMLVFVIPIIGLLGLIYMCLAGNVEENKYGQRKEELILNSINIKFYFAWIGAGIFFLISMSKFSMHLGGNNFDNAISGGIVGGKNAAIGFVVGGLIGWIIEIIVNKNK